MIERLRPLLGTWQGKGVVQYPTIETVAYVEELTFSANESEPLLHFQQRTWVHNEGDARGEPLHWESGFLIELEDGRLQMNNAQNGGRVEVMLGEITAGEPLSFNLRSTCIANDDRILETTRFFALKDGILEYEAKMATGRNPVLQNHLRAQLRRTD